MLKKWLKQMLVCLCILTTLSSIIFPVSADTYNKSKSGSDNATYFIINGKDVEKLFDFSIKDVPNLADWAMSFKTFTVIKRYKIGDSTQYKMYFNTPNLQSIIKNEVTSSISDGYTDNTYHVEDTEWVVKVGKNANKDNVISKYGFNIPSYKYNGEYPKEVMSISGMLPSDKNWLELGWRAIKSLFGVSFISAPNSDNYNTIEYLNHEYTNKNEYVAKFFQKYYLPYFERQIPLNTITADDGNKSGRYFSGPEEVIKLAVTEDAYNAAVDYNKAHSDEYTEACQRYEYWNAYQKGGVDACLALDTLVGNKKYDSYHFLASTDKYKERFNSWVTANPNQAYILINAALGYIGQYRRYGGSGGYLNKPSKYGLTTTSYTENTEYETSVSLAADILKYTENSPEFKANVAYDTYEREETIVNDPTKGKSVITFGEWKKTGTEYTDMSYSDTAAWRDNNTKYYDNDNKAKLSEKKKKEDNKKFFLDPEYKSWTVTTTKYLETKRVNYSINYLYAKNDKDNKMTYEDYKTFKSTCSFNSVTYDVSSFVPSVLQGVHETYTANVELQQKYLLFCEILSRGDDQSDATSKKELLYRQCLISNEGKDDECWSQKHGQDKTSLSLVQVYAFSKIYEITSAYDPSVTELTSADTYEILSRLRAYCGPYYSEVVGNMMKIMCATAKYENNLEPTNLVINDDARVMPYDTNTLTPKDKENYSVTDPRVEIYRSHLIGKLVADIKIDPLALVGYFKPQETIISIAGKITELSVFMQQICNFELLDNMGLSPANMWTNGYALLFMAALALFFIIKTVVAVIKYGTQKGYKLVLAFVLLVFELGLITAISSNPQRVWNTVKNVDTKVISLGELATVYSYKDLEYLFADTSDVEVAYYLPYLDAWSKYNTGYGLLDKQQKINTKTDYRELAGVTLPTINGQQIKHWSILLMDAFNYYGQSDSITTSVLENNQLYNGVSINNNAYRVIDHFLAPRVTIKDNGDTINIATTQNENYNGQLQSGVLDLIVKLLNCILICLWSIIKLFTFVWQWFMFYLFIFRVLLGKGAEGKSTKDIIIETFSPTLALVLIGIFSGSFMSLGMNVQGIIGLITEIGLFFVTFGLIRWWHDLNNGKYYPDSLNWLYWITNLRIALRNRNTSKIQHRAALENEMNGMPEEYSKMNIEEQREVLFDESGRVRSQYRDDRYKVQLANWYERAQALQGPEYNVQLSRETIRQMQIMKSSDYFDELPLERKSSNKNNKRKRTGNNANNRSAKTQDNNQATDKQATEPDNESNNSSKIHNPNKLGSTKSMEGDTTDEE